MFSVVHVLAAAPAVPQGISLEVSGTTIKVKWTANTDGTDGYWVYYGKSSTSLQTSVKAEGKSTTYVNIEKLDPNTIYYFAVAAYSGNETSSNSETKNATTGTGPTKPSKPENFRIQSLDSITSSSVTVAWTGNTSSDLKSYKIYYGTSSGIYQQPLVTENSGFNAYTIKDLESGKRYFFSLSVINNDAQESDKTAEVAADTAPDKLAPPAPEIAFAGMSGPESINIRIGHPIPGLADIKGSRIHWGTISGVYDNPPVEMGNTTSAVISGLSQDVTYYFVTTAYDYNGNESGYSKEKQVTIEKSKTLLSDDSSFSGCFIHTSEARKDAVAALGIMAAILFIAADFFKRSRLFILLAVFAGIFAPVSPAAAIEGDNTLALKYGYFKPSESLQKDIYDNNNGPATVLYERRIYDNFFADLEAGYMCKSGHAVTQSGAKTDIKTEMTIIPVSIGAQYEYEVIPFVTVFGGIGAELWHVSEDPSLSVYKSNDGTVSGWFAKAGLKLFTESEMFKGAGLILESKYSAVSRFGQNDTDLGGILLNAGLFYRF